MISTHHYMSCTPARKRWLAALWVSGAAAPVFTARNLRPEGETI